MGPSGRFTHVIVILMFGTGYMQVLYLGRAPHTKETLPDFREKCLVARHSRVFRGLTGSQRTPGLWGVTVATWRAKVACSRWMYLVSASAKDLLMQNTSLCLPSAFSLNRAALTATSKTARYTKSVSQDLGLTRIGGLARYCLIAIKA